VGSTLRGVGVGLEPSAGVVDEGGSAPPATDEVGVGVDDGTSVGEGETAPPTAAGVGVGAGTSVDEGDTTGVLVGTGVGMPAEGSEARLPPTGVVVGTGEEDRGTLEGVTEGSGVVTVVVVPVLNKVEVTESSGLGFPAESSVPSWVVSLLVITTVDSLTIVLGSGSGSRFSK
jgi:hypothetical protein